MSLENEIVDLTMDMVKFRSVKGNPKEIGKCLEYIKDYFSNEDFIIREYESEGKKSMVISFEETKKPEIMLHGHIDVVDADKEMFEPEAKDGKVYGRGTGDMKAGVACLMNLMKDMKDEKPDVALMIVSDEEIGGFNGAKYLIEEEGYRPDFVISAEPNNVRKGGLDIVVKQKGILHVEMRSEGKSAHGSRPWKGDNAAEKLMSRYMNEVKPLFPDKSHKTWDTTCNLGILESGEAANKVPGKARAKLDVRWSEEYTKEEVLTDLRAIEGVKVKSIPLAESMLNTDPENEYVQSLKRSAEEIHEECQVTRKEPGSDARHFFLKGIPAVVFGPEGYKAHELEEYAVISSFEDYINILKKFIDKK